MTKETRIGLLLGLVFIVMFGLVLSGLTEKNPLEKSPQQLPAGDGKGNYTLNTLPPIEEASPPPATPPVAVTPPPTGAPHPTGAVAVLPTPSPTPADSGPTPIFHGSLARDLPTDPPEPVVIRTGTTAVTPPAPTPPVGPVAIGPGPDGAGTPPVGPGNVVAPTGRVYVVENKETFISIARKFYGAEHAGDYKRIMDANKITDPSALRAGKEITIPPLPVAPAVAVRPGAGGPTTRPAVTGVLPGTIRVPLRADGAPVAGITGGTPTPTPVVVPTPTPTPTPAAGSGRTYVVQSGDTIANIARKFFRDSSQASIAKILKANKIDDPRSLQIGATLAIPS